MTDTGAVNVLRIVRNEGLHPAKDITTNSEREL